MNEVFIMSPRSGWTKIARPFQSRCQNCGCVIAKAGLKRRGRRGFRKGRRGKPSLRSFAIPLASFALKFTLGVPDKLSFDTTLKYWATIGRPLPGLRFNRFHE